MISAVFIYNEKGLKVSKTIFESGEPFFNENIESVDHNHLDLYMKLKLDSPENLPITKIERNSEFSIPTSLSCFYFIIAYDLYFVYTRGNKVSKDNVLEDKFIQEKINERKDRLNFFIGMLVSEFNDDIGPAPIYSRMNVANVNFSEEQLTLLSVQGTTLLGMGQKQMPKYLIGPVPVPHTDYFFLAFSYHRASEESTDPRIKNIGRPTVIFTLLDSPATKEKELIDFIELFLSHWAKTEVGKSEHIKKEDFDRLFRDIKDTISLSRDLIAVRTIQQQEFRLLFTHYYTENLLLKSQNEELKIQLNHSGASKQVVKSGSSANTSKKASKKTTKKAVNKKKKKTSKKGT